MTNDATQPTEAFLRQIDIRELLPQQEPFVMVGRLTHFDMVRTVTETVVDSDNIFVDHGRMSAMGMMENIAQTCAARIGYVNKYIRRQGIQIGFIGAVRNFQVKALPLAGDLITTTVDALEEVFGMTLATATVRRGDEVLVTTEMKIAVRDGEIKSGEKNEGT